MSTWQIIPPAVPMVVIRLVLQNYLPKDSPDRVKIAVYPVVALKHHSQDETASMSVVVFAPDYMGEQIGFLNFDPNVEDVEGTTIYLHRPRLGDEVPSFCIDRNRPKDPLDFVVCYDSIAYADKQAQVQEEMIAAAEKYADQEREKIEHPVPPEFPWKGWIGPYPVEVLGRPKEWDGVLEVRWLKKRGLESSITVDEDMVDRTPPKQQ